MDRPLDFFIDDIMKDQLKKIEREIIELKQIDTNPTDGKYDKECVAVLGGLNNFQTLEAAQQWVENKLWYLYGPKPIEIFSKGSFRGIIFARFKGKGDRDAAVRILKEGKYEEGGHKIWAKPDEDLKTRIIKSLVFGTKQLLITWGWDKAGIWADPETEVYGSGVAIF